MARLSIHRNISLFNVRSPLFLILDNKNIGQLTIIKPRECSIPASEHTVYVKDILGFTSPVLTINIREDRESVVKVSNKLSLLLLLLFLIVFSILLKSLLVSFPASAINPILITIWLISLVVLFIFCRHSFYKVQEDTPVQNKHL